MITDTEVSTLKNTNSSMRNIFGRSPSADSPVVSFYSINQGKLICDKLWVVVCILLEITHSKDYMREMTNHPIHEFTKNLWELTVSQTVAVGELEYINWALQEVTSDLKKLGDTWVIERASAAIRVMEETVDHHYTIDTSSYKEPLYMKLKGGEK